MGSYEELTESIKAAFNQLGTKKLPTCKQLDEEFYRLVTEKKKAYAEHRQVKKDKQKYLIAKQTVEHILGIHRKKQEEQKKEMIPTLFHCKQQMKAV